MDRQAAVKQIASTVGKRRLKKARVNATLKEIASSSGSKGITQVMPRKRKRLY